MACQGPLICLQKYGYYMSAMACQGSMLFAYQNVVTLHQQSLAKGRFYLHAGVWLLRASNVLPKAVIISLNKCGFSESVLACQGPTESRLLRVSNGLPRAVVMCLQKCGFYASELACEEPLIFAYKSVVITCQQCITKTCLYNFDPLKPHFYIVKLGFTGVYIIFLIHNLCFEQEYEKYQCFFI